MQCNAMQCNAMAPLIYPPLFAPTDTCKTPPSWHAAAVGAASGRRQVSLLSFHANEVNSAYVPCDTH
jgi:hypothetical protein